MLISNLILFILKAFSIIFWHSSLR